MLSLLTATSSVKVAPTYSRPARTPPQATAPGSVFWGLSISSPMTEASSSPTRPKQITPNEFRTNPGFAGILKSAAVTAVPNRVHTTIPSPIKSAAAMPVAQDEYGDSDEIEHHRGNVHHVVRPIAPAGEKAVEVAENFLRPKVDAAFPRVAMSELDHGNALRPEKKNQRDHPQPDGDAAVSGYRRNNIQVENGDDKEENEVPLAQNAAQVWCFLRPGLCVDLVRQACLLLDFFLMKISVRPHRQMRGHAPVAPSKARARLLRTRRDACQCPLRCAARRSSIVHPTSRVARARRD